MTSLEMFYLVDSSNTPFLLTSYLKMETTTNQKSFFVNELAGKGYALYN